MIVSGSQFRVLSVFYVPISSSDRMLRTMGVTNPLDTASYGLTPGD